MAGHNSTLDTSLKSWEEIKGQFDKSEILIGNGLSCAVWGKFQYTSLFEKSCSIPNHPLSESDIQFFTEWEANGNFEKVLDNLLITKKTSEILGQSNTSDVQILVRERYNNIRNALIEAVKEVHILWTGLRPNVLRSIREELKNYKCVYSTNYDLLIYWAIMSHPNPNPFSDCFRSHQFDITKTETSESLTRVLYLHGAIHLCRKMEVTEKLVNNSEENILNQFETLWDIENNVTPLFIAEGNSKEKKEAIRRSDYLSFAYSEFEKPKKFLVVFGHSLGDSDMHLINTIKAVKIPKIAISMRAHGSANELPMARLRDIFSSTSDLLFFDSRSHPFGNLRQSNFKG